MSILDIPDSQISQALALLSVERMASYMELTGNERDAIELHDQMIRVAGALMPVTALIEISIRNAVSERLRTVFGTSDWLQNPPAPFVWRGEEKDAIRRAHRHAQRAAYAKKNAYEKKLLDRVIYPNGIPNGISHEARVKARQKAIAVTFGQVVAQLGLGFWKRLFSEDYRPSLWDESLKRLFPDKVLSRSNIAQNLETIYQARNRIAHHEPLFGQRLAVTLNAIDFFVSKFGSQIDGGSTLLERMTERHRAKLSDEARLLEGAISSYLMKSVSE